MIYKHTRSFSSSLKSWSVCSWFFPQRAGCVRVHILKTFKKYYKSLLSSSALWLTALSANKLSACELWLGEPTCGSASGLRASRVSCSPQKLNTVIRVWSDPKSSVLKSVCFLSERSFTAACVFNSYTRWGSADFNFIVCVCVCVTPDAL